MSFSKDNPKLTTDQLAGLIVVLGTLVGLLLRLSLPLVSPFPLNDGGLFYTMILDLRNHHYVFPMVTSYNSADIPFAYPPFGLYITAFLTDLFRIPLLDLLRLAPAMLSAGCIPIFFLLAKEFLETKISAALAAMLFALTPRIFEWQIMGGGITRGFGMIFSLLTMLAAAKMYKTNHFKYFFGTSIFGSLTLLSHPEAAAQTLIAVCVLYLFLSRSRNGLLRSLLVGFFVLVLSSIWWLTIIDRNGTGPFLASISTAGVNNLAWFERVFILFSFEFTREPYLPVIALLSIVGIIFSILNRNYLLPSWMLIHYVLEPRSGSLYMLIPLVMLASIGLEMTILKLFLSNKEIAEPIQRQSTVVKSGYAKGTEIKPLLPVFIILLIYLLVSAYASAFFIYERVTLKPAEVQGFDWINDHIEQDAGFILITGAEPLLDPLSEWFPALTGRKSLATVFGSEWEPNVNFQAKVSAYNELQDCYHQPSQCLENWAAQNKVEFDYILIKKHADPSILSNALMTDPEYDLSFENTALVIYGRHQK